MKKWIVLLIWVFGTAIHAQPALDLEATYESGKRPPINTSGWYPTTVSYAPDETNVIVTACTVERHPLWNPRKPMRCTVMRYQIAAERWETLPETDPNVFYTNVAYTYDGKAIFAKEWASKCTAGSPDAVTKTYCDYLVLLDLNGKKIKNLTIRDNEYVHPSLSQDGSKVLFWGLSDQLYANMGGGAWDVKELDIATQQITQKTDYQAAFPKTTPRYLKDGKRLMLAAEEYPKAPNPEDFFVTVDKRGTFQTNYVGKFGRNMTVVVDAPNAPIKPYFPTLKQVEVDGKVQWQPSGGHMWLIVRDVSRDGTLAVYDDQGIGICLRFVEEPLRGKECITKAFSSISSASIAASNKTVALISGDTQYESGRWSLHFIDVATGKNLRIGMRW